MADVYAQRKNSDLGRTFRRKGPSGYTVHDEANKHWPKSPATPTKTSSGPKTTGRVTHPPGGLTSPSFKPLEPIPKPKPKASAPKPKPKVTASKPKPKAKVTTPKPKAKVTAPKATKPKKTKSSGYERLKKTVARRAIER